MESKTDILTALARVERVERIVAAWCKPWSADCEDLAQAIYLELLSRPEHFLQQLWESGGRDGAINYYIRRIAVRQWYNPTSAWRTENNAPRIRRAPLNEAQDIPTDTPVYVPLPRSQAVQTDKGGL